MSCRFDTGIRCGQRQAYACHAERPNDALAIPERCLLALTHDHGVSTEIAEVIRNGVATFSSLHANTPTTS